MFGLNSLPWWVVLIVGAVVGCVGSLLLSKINVIVVDNDVSIGRLLSIFVTLFLALVVTDLAKRISDVKSREKDIIFRQYELFSDNLDSFSSTVTKGSFLAVKSSLKKVSMCNATISEALRKCGMNDVEIGEISLAREVRELRNLSTFVPAIVRNEDSPNPVSIKGDNVTYSDEQLELILVQVEKLRCMALRSQFTVNENQA